MNLALERCDSVDMADAPTEKVQEREAREFVQEARREAQENGIKGPDGPRDLSGPSKTDRKARHPRGGVCKKLVFKEHQESV